MRMTESQLRSVIRKMLLEFTPALKADAAWSDLTDGSGPMKGLLSGKTVAQAIKDLYGHLLELEPGELEDQYPELDASIITSGDDARALDHLRVGGWKQGRFLGAHSPLYRRPVLHFRDSVKGA